MKALRSGLLALIVAFALCALSVPAIANTGPWGQILVHVQPDSWPPPPPLTDCDQIVQHTPATGLLEFDLYMTLRWPEPFAIDSLLITLEGAEGWNIWDYLIPGDGTGSMDIQGNQGTFRLGWPDCLATDDELLLLLRTYVRVVGPGELGVAYGTDVRGCPIWYGYWLTQTDGFAASAGDVCDYYQESCPPHAHCWPEAATPLVHMQALQGETLQTQLDYEIGDGGPSDRVVSCQGTAAWLEVDGEYDIENDTYRANLEIDTAPMPPGSYSGWVQVDTGGCRACTKVVLEVLTATGVQSLPGISWGRIKSLY